MFAESSRYCSPTRGEITRAAGCDEFEPGVARPRGEGTGQATDGDVYGWFAEGFDTSDLRAAQALLAELA